MRGADGDLRSHRRSSVRICELLGVRTNGWELVCGGTPSKRAFLGPIHAALTRERAHLSVHMTMVQSSRTRIFLPGYRGAIGGISPQGGLTKVRERISLLLKPWGSGWRCACEAHCHLRELHVSDREKPGREYAAHWCS